MSATCLFQVLLRNKKQLYEFIKQTLCTVNWVMRNRSEIKSWFYILIKKIHLAVATGVKPLKLQLLC